MKVVGIVGWKNSGKTSLVERLVAELSRRRLRVSTLKHAHHNFDVDKPGTDSARHRSAGAKEVLISSQSRWALMHEGIAVEAQISDLMAKLEPVDVVLAEGFKQAPIPKIEIRRVGSIGSELAAVDPFVIAVASDEPLEDNPLPAFELDDEQSIADFIIDRLNVVVDRKVSTTRSATSLKSAMPPGVDWMPVDSAMLKLRKQIAPVVGATKKSIHACSGRILAEDVFVKRSNPPDSNSAVDGYGFCYSDVANESRSQLRLVAGQAAAGTPFRGDVPHNRAIRILTGAKLPNGVDTVVLDELTRVEGVQIKFKLPQHRGLNTRLAGEDLKQGDKLLSRGRRIETSDIASLAAAGMSTIQINKRLRVAVISTGNEIAPIGQSNNADIFDANRPMLISMLRRWNFIPVDLGVVCDRVDAVRAVLDRAAKNADAILITGGASSGDEDHVARLLVNEGDVLAWRIAVKPGRPTAFAHWKKKLVFALPGNPVAAFVCAAVFARPALNILAGGEWLEPIGFSVPADFEKQKIGGRREYIRAKLNSIGGAEAFRSEGSGLTSGLAWADGLVELRDDAHNIRRGDFVRYIPFSSFGL